MFKRALLAVALLANGSSTLAQVTNGPDDFPGLESESQFGSLKYPPKIYRQGAWFATARSGSGVFFDQVQASLSSKITAITYYTFKPDGSPLWLLGTGQMPTPSPAGVAVGDFGSITVDTFEGAGGPCPNCPGVAPDVRPSIWGPLSIRFASPYAGRMTVAGVEAAGTLRPSDLQFGMTVADLLKGEWVGVARAWQQAVSIPERGTPYECTLSITAGSNPAPTGYWERGSSAARWLPSAQAVWLNVSSVATAWSSGECEALGKSSQRTAPPHQRVTFETAIAVEPDGLARMPKISDQELIFAPGSVSQVVGYRTRGETYITEFFLASPNELVVWRRFNYDSRRIMDEARFTRKVPL